MRNSIHCFSQSTLFKTHSYFEDPIEFFGENRSVISWTSKISSLVRRDKPEEAIGLFKTMLLSEQRPNYVTILSIVRAVGASGFENMTRVIHGLLIKMGFESEMSVVTTLLGVYTSWDVEIVWKLFDQVPDKDMVLWNAMLSVCTKSGQYIEAFEIFREMQYNGVQPSHVSIVSILPACGALCTLSFGKQIHGFSIKREYYFLTNVQNSLVDMYAKCGYLETSIQVFNRIENKDLVSWRTMIHGCIENKCPRAALNMFSGMRSCCFKPDEVIILDAIGACGEEEKFTLGMGLHGYILKSGFLAFVSVMTALLQMYAKFGEIGSARILFSQIQKKDFIAWSAMISAYAQSGHSLKALDTFKKMQSTNEKPNEITFVSVLQGCSSMGVQELGESIHAHMTKAGYSSNAFLISALIDLYCKFGRIRQGKAIFDEILIKDLVCWSSMINGYGINGYGNEALETFSNMLNCGIKPNEVVFISLLSACSHCGLENEGWNWFYAMEKIYGITPKLAHYACMVDLLSRQGHVEDALEFVKSMPIEPDNRIWGALLAGCRSICGSIEIAEFVVEQLVCLDPENTSCYVVLSNLYAEQCRWEDVEKMRKLVDKKGLRKETGYSIIEANS
ncbi:Pentatricopeptide repeat-containing protein [Camellia lanceoleosa]|uniref:Pentatricopeptide repeat-containing protein n=1 Tax=Camellia lanceoleosa TaxID=1840588 RepID=A0ACC0IHG0_9ERIC|nr:Pentatricopeptide repeat-containing protein [Camellia lanceoleosa]